MSLYIQEFLPLRLIAINPKLSNQKVEFHPASIDDFDEELIQELRKRASEKIETKNKKIEQENSLVSIKELTKNHIESLAKNNINNREDLADLSVDELLEMIDLTKEVAGKIIMDAREPWFNQD